MNDTTFQGDGKVAYVPVVVDAKPKPITNAMKIRAMSDEELAKFMALNTDCYYCKASELDRCASLATAPCGDIWLDWLRQEVNDGKEEKEENQPAK